MKAPWSKDNEQKLFRALSGPNNSIKSRYDAEKFLFNQSTAKKSSERYISWMIALSILSSESDKVYTNLLQLVSNYEMLLDSKLNDRLNDPLSALSDDTKHQIQNDLNRTIKFFNELATSSNLPNTKKSGAVLRASRILALLQLSDNSFRYLQGYERYVFVCYLISVLFTTENDLPDIVAEASAYYLSSKMIELSGAAQILSNSSLLEQHFHKLDEKLVNINASLMNHLTFSQQSSINFALRWELLLFAEEHNYHGLVLIWDRIIAHRQMIHQYIESLILAHFAQLPETRLNNVQHFKEWNIKQLLDDAEKYASQYSYFHWSKALMVAITVGAVSLVKLIH